MADEIENTGTLESLSDVFNDSKAETAETADKPAEEKGETEVKTPEKEETKVAETPSAEETGLKAALTAERRKRQEAEEKLREKETKTKIPDPIEDPEGYANHLRVENGKVEFKTRIALSRDLMMDAKEDFADKEKVFMELVSDADGNIIDESLFRRFQESPNPARFAYNHAKEHLEILELKSPDYKEKLKAELRKELEEEMKSVSATQVPNLTKATAAGSNSQKVEELTELSDMFKDSRL